jgi:hypothetical protein
MTAVVCCADGVVRRCDDALVFPGLKEMALMSKVRLVLLGVLAALSAVAMTASAASAISFEYLVSGKLLAAGESRTFDVATDGKTTVLKGTVAGTGAELLSSVIKVAPGAKIFGGKPGTNEETVEFENVSVDKPGTCKLEGTTTIGTVPLKSEIVEGSVEGAGNGEAYILFTPKSGTLFTSFKLTNKTSTESCLAKGLTLNVDGSVLALVLPQKADATLGDLDYEAATKQYKNNAGTAVTAGLTFAGEPATLTGLTLVLLTSKESFGVF